MTPEQIAQHFRAARAEMGLEQAELAPLIGYNGSTGNQTISQVERAVRSPGNQALRALEYLLTLHRNAPDLLPDDFPRRQHHATRPMAASPIATT